MNEEGIHKSAVLLLSLGEEQAVQVLKHLSQLEVQKLGAAMAKLKNLSMGQIDAVLSDFCSRIVAEPLFLDLDPESYARTVLERALGEDKSTDNISRILPPDKRVFVKRGSWPIPPVFQWMQKLGNVADAEMFRVFNMGVGFAIIAPPGDATGIIEQLQQDGIAAWIIGDVRSGGAGVEFT